MLKPKSEALAFRIWAYAKPREWNVTAKELSEALNVTTNAIGAILRAKKWNHRIRITKTDGISTTFANANAFLSLSDLDDNFGSTSLTA